MSRRRIFSIVIAITLALSIGYLLGQERSSGDSLVIRTYPVPPSQGSALKEALKNLLYTSREKQADGNIELMNNNLLVVKTTKHLQKDVSKFIAEFTKNIKEKSQIKFEYWVVIAREGTPTLNGTGELKNTIEALPDADKKSFSVVDHLTLQAVEFERAENRGGTSELKVENAIVIGDHIQTHISLYTNAGPSKSGSSSSIKANIDTVSGNFLVVTTGSSSSSMAPVFGAASEKVPAEIYHIVRATILK